MQDSKSLEASTGGAAVKQVSWQSALNLTFELRQNATILTKRHHKGALRVQRALYPEADLAGGICHVLILYPPAGLAFGDDLRIAVQLQADAQVVLTTPGANKWYGHAAQREQASEQPAQQRVVAELQARARLEWLPQENCFYNGSQAISHNRFVLDASASLIAWEINLLGRALSDEPYDEGQLDLRNLFWRRHGQGSQVQLINADSLQRSAGADWFDHPLGLGGERVFGTMWVIPPVDQLDQLIQWSRHLQQAIAEQDLPVQCTQTGQLLLIRYRGQDARQCLAAFSVLRGIVRGLLWQLPDHVPRIWAT